jgi:hypothetical protein
LDIDTLDFRLLDIDLELSALDYHLKILEEQIKNKTAFERLVLQKEIKKRRISPDEPDWQYLHEEFYHIADFLLPRLFRAPYLVSLYAVYESSVIEIASIMQKQKDITISINDLRGDFLERAKIYFKSIIDFKLCSDKAWHRITMLSVLRNAIAHANGRIEMLKNEIKTKIKTLEKQKVGISIENGFVIVDDVFLRDTLSLVSSSLNDLVERYKKWDDNQLARNP